MADVFLQYHGDSLYLAAFAASLAFLYWREKKKQGATGKKAVTALLLAVVFVFNEAAYQIVGRLTNAATYYRFFWMLPVVFLLAYTFTEAVFEGNRIQKIFAAAAFLMCLFAGANLFFLNRENYNRPINIYGLDPNVLTIADAIMDDWDSGQGLARGKDQPTAAFDMYLEYQVRTYEPRILWGISRQAYLYQAEHGYDHKKYVRQQQIIAAVHEGIQNDGKALRRSLMKNGVDYLAIRSEFDMDSYLAAISVIPVAQSDTYTLYRVMP